MSKDKRWLRWTIQSDPGILRKKADAETDLFVFGYACKIFRDDQKALEMDQGKHLIPWMGDETLKIDRYDARGHLSEISQFEGTNQDYVLTPEERRIEQLCDEERYHALHHNEEEQEMYQEEELKRLKQALSSDKEYRQVAYQYESDGAPPSSSEPDTTTEDEEPFTPSPSLYLPANMKLPSTVKENQIIEKTAAHIASHGPQVEILIKTRQANNQKLSFLHVGSPLNPYYNFILSQIKTGSYKPAFMIQQEAENNQENEHYLHPSLAPAPSTTVESAPSIPSIAYKPSSDCFYNMLVNKIRNMQQSQESVSEVEEPSTSEDSPLSQRKRRKRSSSQTHLPAPAQKQVADPPQQVKEIISRLINFAHSRDLHPSEIASNLLQKDSKNLGFVEPGHKYYDYYVQQLQETYKENIYNLSNPSMEAAESEETNSFDPVNSYDPERPTEEDHSISSPIPQELPDSALPSVDNHQSATPSEYDVPNHPSSKPAPVCFSIKKPKETERLEHVSAFPLEESSSDEEGKEEGEHSSTEKEKHKHNEGDKLLSAPNSHPVTEESMKTRKSSKEKEHQTRCSPARASPEVVVISSHTSSEGGKRSVASTDSRKTTSSDSRKSYTTTSSDSRKSYTTNDSKKSSTSSDSKKSLTSTDSRKTSSSSDSRKATSSEGSKKTYTLTSSDSKKSLTSSDSSRKTQTSDSRKSTSTEGSSRKSVMSSDSSRRNKEKKSSRKHKSSSLVSPDKYKEQGRGKRRSQDEKNYQDVMLKIRRESDDLPPLPDDPITNLSTVPEENLEKKREERKKKVKQMIEKIKTESLGLQENSQASLKAGVSIIPTASDASIALSKSFLPLGPTSFLSKSNNKTEEAKSDSQKDFEEQLREQVKQSLKKIAETTLAAIPPISEDSCSQFEHSSAANSNGFETPSSCGRPIFRVSRTPSVGVLESALQEPSSSRSSSSVSRRSHKRKKHHKKKKKHKGRSKAKKHRESDSESSSDDESSNDLSESSSDSEPHKKRYKKSSKRSRKRHKRKHRKHSSSSSSSSD